MSALTENLIVGGVDAANNILSQGMAWLRDRDARQWQEDMWNKQNEYNLPINQRKRLEEAGLNPNLAFGHAASAMGTSVPGSPSTHVPSMNLGEFWLRYRQAKAEIQAREADTKRTNEITRQLDLNNQILEILFNDKIQTERGDFYIRRIEQAWKEDHLKEMLDLGLSKAEIENDILNLKKAYQAKDNDMLQRELDHIIAKYGFEDFYYEDKLNPYPAGHIIGFAQGFGRIIQLLLERISEYFD